MGVILKKSSWREKSLRRSGCNTLSHSGLANVYTRKRMFYPLIVARERSGLVVESLTPEREVGLDTYLRRVVSLSLDTFTPRKVLVIPRKQWLHPNITEKLVTGTLTINTNNDLIVANQQDFAIENSNSNSFSSPEP